MDIYHEMGINTIINAAGTYTKYGGSLISPEVLDAMKEASKSFVDIDDLLKKTGKYIAELLDAEAALVTAGAASGLALSTAACMVGDNQNLINKLPDTEGLKNEVVIMRCHRNPYDQAIRGVGARFVEIGNAIETNPWELKSAITEKTAAVAFFVQSDMLEASLSLPIVLEIAHSRNVPVIVDAAAELPPIENLFKFTKMGADIVLFSGGKDLRGPQSSGLLLGKRELVDMCLLQGYPHHAIGRPMKLDKETIMGLVKAVELYLNEDHKKRMEIWESQVDRIVNVFEELPQVKVFSGYPTQPLTQPASIPRVFIQCDSEKTDLTNQDIAEQLFKSERPIVVVVDRKYLQINPHMLQKGEEEIIIERIKEILK